MLQETPLGIAINGTRRVLLTCSPHDAVELAIGHLIAEGWMASAAEAGSPEVHGSTVHVNLDPLRVQQMDELRAHQLAAGCGLRHWLDCNAEQSTTRVRTFSRRDAETQSEVLRAAPASGDLVPLFKELFAAVDAASPEGGVHAVGVTDGTALLLTSIDVARHCAVDRAIGAAAMAGVDLGVCGIIATARISGAMAAKAVHSGVGWIASRSVATTLAHELAAAAGVQIVERAGRTPRAA